jgi:short-subunit dehydrogenase
MNKDITGKIIVITGASSGIGAEMAVFLASKGAIPVLLARRADKLAEVALRIQGEYKSIFVDVTDGTQVQSAVDDILTQYSRIDIWINNAGVGAFESFMDMPFEGFERLMDVNYFSIVRCTKAVLPAMLQAGSGHIINVVSVAGKIGTAKATAYSASKHAALGFTNSLRAELASTKIKVSSVNPGPIDTPFFDIADPEGNYKKNVSWYMLSPEQVTYAIWNIIRTGKAEITLPFSASFGAKLLHLFPNLLSSIANRLLNRK